MNTDTIRFDMLYGRCAKCEGPVYFSQVIDWEGNKVSALQCWNGHYEHIKAETFVFPDDRELSREEIEEILPFIGFIRIDD
ncbi:hypothetical protein MNBD_NITROSPINAE04-1413 [hydrothermal vent metagenome]|uniref:Uncharacterized protein n=1 Tax=hydrothermal vent metagenome TaxID=652676 RepID=A0A3B1C2L1_9ZZZZ